LRRGIDRLRAEQAVGPMGVEISQTRSTQPSFSAGKPRVPFDGPYRGTINTSAVYDVTADGQQFLMTKESETQNLQINVVLNWFEELNRRVRTGKT
jgi:hypothetical protein